MNIYEAHESSIGNGDPIRYPEGIDAGSMILTSDGLVRVEELERHVLVQTRDHGLLPLADVFPVPDDNCMTSNLMRVSEGVLGAVQELYLGCGQHVALQHMLTAALFGKPTALVRIAYLANDSHVERVSSPVGLYKLILPQRCLIQVNGVWLASHAGGDLGSLPAPELTDAEARAAGECGLFIRRKGEAHARKPAAAVN